jgi:hypothetical protein
MLVMGDWAKRYLEQRSGADGAPRTPWVPNEDFGVEPAWSGSVFTFNAAGFARARNPPHPNAAGAFLEVVGSQSGQAVFATGRGTIPARLGVPVDGLDSMLQEAYSDYSSSDVALLPGYPTLVRFDFQLEINPALLVFAVGGARARDLDPDNVPAAEESVDAFDIDYLVAKLEASYELL